ncbi:unnamed protein product, partial [Iphiclides podalirius]
MDRSWCGNETLAGAQRASDGDGADSHLQGLVFLRREPAPSAIVNDAAAEGDKRPGRRPTQRRAPAESAAPTEGRGASAQLANPKSIFAPDL